MPRSPKPPPLFPHMGHAAQLLATNTLPKDFLAAHRLLSKVADPVVVRAALALHGLRQRAAHKFRNPSHTLLLPKGLEQATDGRVAAWRAGEIQRLAPQALVWDCTAGLGADAIALAERGMRVLASDLDPLIGALAGHNLDTIAAKSSPSLAFAGDATRPPLLPSAQWVLLLDPDRRSEAGIQAHGRPGGARQRLDLQNFSPSIESWPNLLDRANGAAVKLPPGLGPSDLEPFKPMMDFLARVPHRWTWTEAGGSLRELTLWTGSLASGSAPFRSAVRLFGPGFPEPGETPDHAALSRLENSEAVSQEFPEPEAITLVAEMRPSVRRAGLAQEASKQIPIALQPINEAEDYFASSEPIPDGLRPSPFVDLFRVLASAPLDKKRVRKIMAPLGIGTLTIKKRGLSESSATLEQRLAGKKGLPGLAIAAPTRAGRRLFLVERIEL